MRIGELSQATGLPRDTIRFYERQGLIASAPSTEPTNTYRDYSAETVERLAMIVEARGAGLSVPDLRRLFRHLDGMADAAFDAEGFLDEKIAETRAIIARSRRLLTMLERTRTALAPARRPRPRGGGRS